MSTGRKGGLTAEDRELWNRIRRSVTPLRHRASLEDWLDPQPAGPAPPPPAEGRSPPAPLQPAAPFLPPYRPPVARPAAAAPGSIVLDDHTVKRIRKGRLEIDARIDLHGMTQVEAHRSLYRFLEDAQSLDMRIVLVITGKGRSGDGILRRTVPLWLGEPMFHRLVGGWRNAHVTHGGEGAIYVRVRRHSGGEIHHRGAFR